MPRPSGAPFWGESRATTWGYAQLSGVADLWDAGEGAFSLDDDDALSAVGAHGEGTTLDYDNFARLHSGGSWVLMSAPGDTYLEGTDTSGWEASWVIRVKGSGTLTLTDDTDPGWSYSLPTANSLASVVVSGSDWTDYEVPTTSFSITDLMSGDANRLGIVVSGGSAVDVDVVYLRIWPTGGPLGAYVSKPTETLQSIPQVSQVDSGLTPTASGATYYEFDPEDDGGTGYAAAYSDMLADAASDPAEESRSSGVAGRGFASTNASTEVISSLAGSEHVGRWALRSAYAVINMGDLNRFQPSEFMGTDVEGVDWIRRPDRCEFDLKAWYEYVTPGAEPEMSGWLNTDARLVGYRNVVGTSLDDWADGTGITVNFDDYPYDLPPNSPTSRPPVISHPIPTSGDFYELADTSGGAPQTDETVALTLPLSPKFMMSLGNTFTDAPPPQSGLRFLSFTGASVAQVATLYLRWDSGTESQLIGVVAFPPFKVWNPTGSNVSWVRNIQRNDGLGTSPWRWGSNVKVNVRVVGITFSGFGSNQSIRWRGTR